MKRLQTFVVGQTLLLTKATLILGFGISRHIGQTQIEFCQPPTLMQMGSGSDTPIKENSNKHDIINQIKSIISDAISKGAPAYNAGDIKGCAEIYKSASEEIITMENNDNDNALPVTFKFKTSLEQTIQSTESSDDANEVAWAFRRQFDSIMDYQIPFMPDYNDDNDNDNDNDNKHSYTLEKFSDDSVPLSPEPMIINDNVMGGLSQGVWSNEKVFAGTTSLANNGGFASLRWRMNRVQNWNYAKGVYLKVSHTKPQEHTFRIILKDVACEQISRGANYKNVFFNPYSNNDDTNDPMPIFIPFTAFIQMESRGQPLIGPCFNRGTVTEIGIMAIKPSVVGEFKLKINEWGLYY